MAYTNLTSGSRGSGVTQLQQALKNKGYNIAVDGIYGNETANAVRQYQTANNLSVDGIAGDQTQTSLFSGANAATGATAGETGTDTGYKTGYEDQQTDLLAQLLGYGKDGFSYDAASDPAYAEAKKAYLREADRAQENSMAQQATMTGGMPSTQAVTASQQAGDYYRTQFGDAYNDYYNQAYQEYMDKYSMLGDQLGAVQNADNTAYQRYADQRDFDYQQYIDQQNLALDRQRIAASTSSGSGSGSGSKKTTASGAGYGSITNPSSTYSSENSFLTSVYQDSRKINYDAVLKRFAGEFKSGKLSTSEYNVLTQFLSDLRSEYPDRII